MALLQLKFCFLLPYNGNLYIRSLKYIYLKFGCDLEKIKMEMEKLFFYKNIHTCLEKYNGGQKGSDKV